MLVLPGVTAQLPRSLYRVPLQGQWGYLPSISGFKGFCHAQDLPEEHRALGRCLRRKCLGQGGKGLEACSGSPWVLAGWREQAWEAASRLPELH